MARRGNTSVSSLLRAAQSEYNRVQNYNDSLAAYEFQLSDKSASDYQKYDSYLNGRISKLQTVDPSKALSLDKTRTSAYRSFNSSEISRASTEVLYGGINNRQKYGQMVNLYQQAVQNGDQALAQSIEGQLARLSITIQNEEETAANRAASDAERAAKANYKAYKSGYQNALKQVSQDEARLKRILNENKVGDREYTVAAATLMLKKAQALEQAGKDPNLELDDQEKYQKDYDSLIANGTFQKIASPVMQERIQRGEDPFSTYVDPLGKKDFFYERKVVAREPIMDEKGQVAKDEFGNPITKNVYEKDALSGDKFKSFYRQNQLGQEQDYTTNVYDTDPGRLGAKQGQQYYIDPVSGRQIFVRRDPSGKVQRGLALAGGQNPFDVDINDPIKPEGGGTSDRIISGLSSLPGKAFRTLPVVGAGYDVLSSIFTRSEREQKIQQEKAAQAAAAIAEQKRLAGLQRIITASPSVVRLANPAPVAKPKSSNILPGTPAQVFKAVAGPNPSKPAIASGIAAIAGYDKYANIFGR